MKTIKFDEGKKCETSFDFDDDEVVIFGPVDNRTIRFMDEGCLMGCLTIATLFLIRIFKPIRRWDATFVLTNKRLVCIPTPPNKKNYPAESFYYTDIVRAYKVKPTDPKTGETSCAIFGLVLKPGAPQAFKGDNQFWIWAAINAKYFANMAKQLGKQIGTGLANQFSESNDMIQTQNNEMTAKARGDKYYKVVETAKIKLEAMDTSDAGHVQIRDFFIELINDCVVVMNG